MKVQYYYPDVGKQVGLNNRGPIFNTRFRKWRPHVGEWLAAKSFPDYESSEGERFLNECTEHERIFARGITAPNMIVLVHPFYTALTHYYWLEGRTAQEFETYTENLVNLLNANLDRNKVGIMAFDTTYHYSSLTSSLLEQGKLDRVLFTENDRGDPLDGDDFSQFVNKRIFFGGGYANRCLFHTGNFLRRKVVAKNHSEFLTPGKGIHLMSDLVIKSPQLFDSMLIDPQDFLEENVSVGFKVEETQLVTSGELIERFK